MTNPAVWNFTPLAMAWEIWRWNYLSRPMPKSRKEKRVLGLKYEVLIPYLGRKRSTLMSAVSHSCQFDLEVSSIWSETGARWSVFQLWDVCPRFKSLKFGCHGLSIVPSKEIQAESLFLMIPNHKCGIKLEAFVWRVMVRYLRKLNSKSSPVYRYIIKRQRQQH